MAGGRGTRFWPLSRITKPKQFLRILSDKTLLEETVKRISPLVPFDRTYIVTARSHFKEVLRLLPTFPRSNVLVEPEGRNTAAAIGLAAITLSKSNPEAVMVVLPSDHVIREGKRFIQSVRVAVGLAQRSDKLVTIGIKPTRPETGYGYIKKGAKVSASRGIHVYEACGFKEKPALKVAERYVKSKEYLWNSGIFVWKAGVIVERLQKWMPELSERLDRIRRHGSQKSIAEAYRRMPSVSIDRGVLEREKSLWLVEADLAWSDVGSWQAAGEIWGAAGRPAYRGNVVSVESEGVIAHSPQRLIALLGVKDLIVVDSQDAVLIADRSRAQDVGMIVSELQRRRQRSFL